MSQFRSPINPPPAQYIGRNDGVRHSEMHKGHMWSVGSHRAVVCKEMLRVLRMEWFLRAAAATATLVRDWASLVDAGQRLTCFL